jgi:16S rRNA (adenine1518-N6/adenine1519-N6)-dimethyltransferase
VADEGRAHRPRKRFGQHFLTDRRSLERIVEALDPQPDDTVVEIGPGRGALTSLLAARCRRLIAIEIDRDLVRLLQEQFQDRPGVEIVDGDALETDWATLAGGAFLLAGNLPYYITTPLIFRILEHPMPQRAVLLVQREVAERLVAAPGSGDYGALTVNVQVAVTVRIISRVSAGAFNPKPKVDSAIVLLSPRNPQSLGADEEKPFRRFVQAVFGMRRKQMLRVVRELWIPAADDAGVVLSDAGIDPAARPETLKPETFLLLYREITRRHVRFMKT